MLKLTRSSVLLKKAEDCLGQTKDQVLELINLKKIINSNPDLGKLALKMAGGISGHPFIATAGELFFNENSDIRTPGILVLLMSKMTGHRIDSDTYYSNGFSERQILLARAMVQSAAAYRIHRTVQESKDKYINQGNKLATLAGDLLVVNTIRNVAAIGNNQVFEWTMNALADFTSSEISRDNNAEAALLSSGFRSTLYLNGHPEQSQEEAAKLGYLMGSLWKHHLDEQGNNCDIKLKAESILNDSFTHVLEVNTLFKNLCSHWSV